MFNQATGHSLHHQQTRKKWFDMQRARRNKVVAVEEERVAETYGEFYAHGRGTGGGPPLYPPQGDEDEEDEEDEENEDDINYLPVSLPGHLQVMGPPVTEHEGIVRGPPARSIGNINELKGALTQKYIWQENAHFKRFLGSLMYIVQVFSYQSNLYLQNYQTKIYIVYA